jgi:hypothetical protein
LYVDRTLNWQWQLKKVAFLRAPIMQSGHVYKVDSVDSVDTQLWLSGDDVLICGDMMINKDEQGEKASVTLLH